MASKAAKATVVRPGTHRNGLPKMGTTSDQTHKPAGGYLSGKAYRAAHRSAPRGKQ